MGYIHTELFPGITIGDFSPVHIMAVINLSPESFYKQSYIAHEKISEKALRFIRQGVTILDLGARSTAPWSDPITLKEEKNRIKNALNELKPILTEIPKSIMISIDTQYAEVAEVAIDFAQDHPEKVK